jgi:hypothetical protein
MTNPILFATSWIMLVLHAVTFIYLFSKNVPLSLVFLYIGGSLTSIINHGTSNFVSKWIDRIVMTLGLCIDIWYIVCKLKHSSDIVSVSLPLAVAILTYFLDKCQPKTYTNHNNDHYDNYDDDHDEATSATNTTTNNNELQSSSNKNYKTLPHAVAHFCIIISHIMLLFCLTNH